MSAVWSFGNVRMNKMSGACLACSKISKGIFPGFMFPWPEEKKADECAEASLIKPTDVKNHYPIPK